LLAALELATEAIIVTGIVVVGASLATEIAKAEASFFPKIHQDVLASTIATYQKLGNWTPHVEITRPAFEAALDVFQNSGGITKRHAYEDIIASPPA
jgi:NitT/TauT family transport system substrate-binding protein